MPILPIGVWCMNESLAAQFDSRGQRNAVAGVPVATGLSSLILRTGGSPRRLPYVATPVSGESWASWLDRGAARAEVPVGVHVLALGLQIRSNAVGIRPTFSGVVLPPHGCQALVQSTGLSPQRLEAMQLSSYRKTVLSFEGLDVTDESTIRLFACREWCQITASRACPYCLRDRPVWKLWWRLGIAAACPEHGVLLLDVCPRCAIPLRQGFARHPRGLSRMRLTDPSLCGNAVARGCCQQPIADLETRKVSPALVRAQVEALKVAAGTHATIAGVVVMPHEWFAAVKFLAALMRYSGTAFELPSNADPRDGADMAAVVDDYNATRSRTRLQSGSLRAIPRTASVAAGVLIAASYALTTEDPEMSAEVLRPAVRAAAALRRNRRSINVMGRIPAPPPLASICSHLDTPGARVAGRITVPIGSGGLLFCHVPHLLDDTDYHLLIPPHLPHTAPISGRRFSALALARLIGARSWPDAAAQLDMNRLYAQRVSDTLVRRIQDPDAFWEVIGAVYQLMSQRPRIDYRHRRRALEVLYTIPAELMREACNGTEVLITEPRCTHAATWVWQQLTQGDMREAPAYQQQLKRLAPASAREGYRRFCRWLPALAGRRLLAAVSKSLLTELMS